MDVFCIAKSALGVLASASLLVSGSALALDEAPQLLGFQVVTSVVNSSASPAIASFTAQISDAAPGVCTFGCDDFGGPSQLQLVHSGTGQRYTALFSLDSGNDYTAEVTLPTFSAGGQWDVESIWLADLAGNRVLLRQAELSDAGFASSVQNDSATGDEAAPTLTSVALAPLAFDATAGNSVNVDVMATDAGSGLCTIGCEVTGGPSQVRFVNASTGQLRDALFAPFGMDFRASVSFPAGSATGTWTLASLQLVDLAGNRAFFDAAALGVLGFTTELAVTSSSADEDAPTLVDASSVPDPVDTTLMGVTATFSATATDPGTGLCLDMCDDFGTASQVRYQRSGTSHFRFGLLALATGSRFDGSFDALVDLPISGSADVWRARQVLLVDQAGNRIFAPEPGFATGSSVALLALALLSRRTGRCR